MSSRRSIVALVVCVLALLGFLVGWSLTAGPDAPASAAEEAATATVATQAVETGPLGPGEVLLGIRFLSVKEDENGATFTGLVERVEPEDGPVKQDSFVTVTAGPDTLCVAGGQSFTCSDRSTVLGKGGGATVRGAVEVEGTRVTVAATSIQVTG